MRREFVDRLFSAGDLAALADMVRRWFLARAIDAEQTGQFQIEAWIFALPQQRRKELIRSLSARVAEATFDDSDPDHVTAIDPPETLEYPSQITLWRELLAAPEVKQGCLTFRMIFRGTLKNLRGLAEEGTATFVLCGSPSNDGLLVKAIWQEKLDRGSALTSRLAAWYLEKRFLEAFDRFREQCGKIERDAAAGMAYDYFSVESKRVFWSHSDEERVMQRVRQRVELPDERGPAAFARRCGVPLLTAIVLGTLVAIFFNDFPLLAIAVGVSAFWMFARSARIAWSKLWQIVRYHRAMHRGLGTLHSAPIEYTKADLSTDPNPTLLKYSAEIEDLGARHICDLVHRTARGTSDGSRYYQLDDALVSLGHLRRTENFLFFPARAVLLITTEFRDGGRHVTTNHAHYRRKWRTGNTRRCVLNAGGAADVMAAHRRTLEKRFAAGAVAKAPPGTPEALIAHQEALNAEARDNWKKSPYSWGDAFHQAFKICRREYLVD